MFLKITDPLCIVAKTPLGDSITLIMWWGEYFHRLYSFSKPVYLFKIISYFFLKKTNESAWLQADPNVKNMGIKTFKPYRSWIDEWIDLTICTACILQIPIHRN